MKCTRVFVVFQLVLAKKEQGTEKNSDSAEFEK